MDIGKIVVYTGPMKSGKTTALITKYLEIKQLNQYRIKMFKPTIDSRFSNDYVMCRNEISVKAINIEDLQDLLQYKDDYDIFFIDEFQFITGDINILRDLLSNGKSLYISGLNLTAECKVFGLMGDLLCNATKIIYLKGICDECGSINGTYSYYTPTKTNDIAIGDDEYLCLCPSCYNRRMKNGK